MRKVVRNPGFRSVGPQTTAWLWRDWVPITLNRAREGGGGYRRVTETLLAIVLTLTPKDLEEEEYDPYNGEETPCGPVGPETGGKGLGRAGCVPIPEYMWSKHAPLSLEGALNNLPD